MRCLLDAREDLRLLLVREDDSSVLRIVPLWLTLGHARGAPEPEPKPYSNTKDA